jgi:hypothetical protein
LPAGGQKYRLLLQIEVIEISTLAEATVRENKNQPAENMGF